MLLTSISNTRIRRLGRVSIALAAAGLIVTAGACSSGDDATATSSAPPTAAPTTTASATRTTTATTVAATTTRPPTTEAATTVAQTTDVATTVAPTTTQPDPARQELLSGILEAHHAAGEFVGARIALLDADGAITEVSEGTQTIDPASPLVDLDTPWNIGSLTKTMVAVVVLQLAEERRIDLDAGIAQYMPGLEGAEQITPRMLLQHTSGLNEYKDTPAVLADRQREWTPSELIAVAEGAGRVGGPGEHYHYSNTNYVVLGEIIGQVTGHPWSDEVQTRIAEPLGMTHTSLLVRGTTPGFAITDAGFVDATEVEHPSLGGAAGGMQSTGRDLLTYGTALFDGTLLSPQSQAAMQTFVPGDDLSAYGITHSYGLGLERYETDAVTVLGHLGTGLQGSFLGYDPAGDTLVAVTSNTQNPESTALMALQTLSAIAANG